MEGERQPTPGRTVHAGTVIVAVLCGLYSIQPAVAQTISSRQDSIRHATMEGLDPDRISGSEDDDALLLLDDPVDVNKASIDRLVSVPGISTHIATNIVAYRSRHGPFDSVEAMVAVPGFNTNLLTDIAAYLTVSGRTDRRRTLQLHLVQTLRRRLNLGRGFQPSDNEVSGYAGGPWKSSTRISLKSERFTAHVMADHDAGEPFTWQPSRARYGPDFVSWSAAYHGRGILRTAVIGDIKYRSRLGLAVGLDGFTSFEQPFSLLSPGLPLPLASTRESRRLRGIALLFSTGTFDMTIIGSRRMRDARIDTAAAGDVGFRLMEESGYHRTDNEIGQRKNLREHIAIARIGLNLSALSMGLTAQTVAFGSSVHRGDRPDEVFDFSGRQQHVIGVDAAIETENSRCAAEASLPLDRSLGAAALCSMSLSDGHRVWIYGRYLGRSPASLIGATMVRGSGPPSNEQGMSIGWRSRPFRRTTVTAYGDIWWSPWVRFQTWAPTTGSELGIRVTAGRGRNSVSLKLAGSLRENGATLLDQNDRAVRGTEKVRRIRMTTRATISANATTEIILSSSMSLAQIETQPGESGTMLAASIHSLPCRPLDLRAGIALFDAPTQLTTIYTYESEMRFGFGARSLSGTGERWYVLASLRPASSWAIQAKYSSSSRHGAQTVGSGLEEISGGRVREFGFQIEYDLR